MIGKAGDGLNLMGGAQTPQKQARMSKQLLKSADAPFIRFFAEFCHNRLFLRSCRYAPAAAPLLLRFCCHPPDGVTIRLCYPNDINRAIKNPSTPPMSS